MSSPHHPFRSSPPSRRSWSPDRFVDDAEGSSVPDGGESSAGCPHLPEAYADAVFEQLDYVYAPSRDVAADVTYYTEVLGGHLVFAIDAMGTRVAMIELTDAPPRILLAGHLEGDQPILVYRVADLEDAIRELEARGWRRGHTLEIPQGPVCSFETPSGRRLAIYERVRPQVEAGFTGRRDF